MTIFYRVEFQQRGSPHIHMLVWVENAPTLETKSEEEIIEFVDGYLTCSSDNEKTANLINLQSHKHSRTCRKLEDHWSCSSPERLSHCKLMRFKLIENRPMKVYAWTLLTPGAWPNLTQGHDWHNL